jgi:protoheme IX farnesyltransferase
VKEARADTAPVPLRPLGPLGSTRRLTAVLSDYVALTKPRLNGLVVTTSAAGYYLGSATAPAPWSMAQAVCGTALVAAGSAVLNQVYERDTDALMRRTRLRPLPDGRITADEAAIFGVGLAALGILLLAIRTNGLAALLALATLILYVVIYTPLKRRSEIATLVGAIPGALPPLIGWAAGHGSLSVGGWVLFAMVFLWQIPHFMAISWLYREDYGKGGFPLLAVIDPAGRSAGRQALIYAWALLPVSLLPTVVGVSGRSYFWIALLLGSAIVWLSWRFAVTRSEPVARALFIGSIVYLPLIWAAMILNH